MTIFYIQSGRVSGGLKISSYLRRRWLCVPVSILAIRMFVELKSMLRIPYFVAYNLVLSCFSCVRNAYVLQSLLQLFLLFDRAGDPQKTSWAARGRNGAFVKKTLMCSPMVFDGHFFSKSGGFGERLAWGGLGRVFL